MNLQENILRIKEMMGINESEREIFDFSDLVNKGVLWVTEPHVNGELVPSNWEGDSNIVTLWNLKNPELGQEWVYDAIRHPKPEAIQYWTNEGQFSLSQEKYQQILRSIKMFNRKNVDYLNENVEEKKIDWVKPDFQTEENEFMNHFLNWMKDDVLQVNFDNFSKKQLNQLVDDILSAYENANVETLTDEEWSKMENTDSWTMETYKDLFDIIYGEYGRSEERIIKHSIEPLKNGGIVETPIVAYVNNHPPYLIAGNTRLSVCKLLGITPKVTKVIIKTNIKEEKKSGEKWIKCVNCNKKFTQTIYKGKKSLPICPHCGTNNDIISESEMPVYIRRRLFGMLPNYIRDTYPSLAPWAFNNYDEYMSRIIFNVVREISLFSGDSTYDEMMKIREKILPTVTQYILDYFSDEIYEYYLDNQTPG
jgi:hypothetical protein